MSLTYIWVLVGAGLGFAFSRTGNTSDKSFTSNPWMMTAVGGVLGFLLMGPIAPHVDFDKAPVALVDDTNFQQEVVGAELPVFVYFYAPWCGGCKRMSPRVIQTAEEYEGRVKVAVINIDNAQRVASRHRISRIPAWMIYNDSRKLDDPDSGPPVVKEFLSDL